MSSGPSCARRPVPANRRATWPLRAWYCPVGRAPTWPPERSLGCSQSLKSSPVTFSSRRMSSARRGSTACRSSQVSGWRGRASRCRNRSSPVVTATPAAPGRCLPAVSMPRNARDRTAWVAERSGWAVTFSRGMAEMSPCSTPRNALISSSTCAGSSSRRRYLKMRTCSLPKSSNRSLNCSPYRPRPV
jgi:hypothetical protein